METNQEENQELAQRLRSEMHHQTADNIQPQSVPVPVIRTLESDILGAVQNKEIDQISTLSKQLDSQDELSQVQSAALEMDNNKKYKVLFLLFLLIALAGGGAYYYVFLYKKATPKAVVQQEVKKYYVKDVWPEAGQAIVRSTADSTSTDKAVIMLVKDFDVLYSDVLSDENIFQSIAKNKFGYGTLEKFVDLSIGNQKLRIADAGSGALVYGFVDKKYLLLTGSIGDWLRISTPLKQNQQ